MIEFYWNHNFSHLLCEDIETNRVARFSELDRSFILKIDRRIAELFPTAYDQLSKWRGSGPSQAYGRVYQFAACNFSEKDGRPDIDEDFNIIPERVKCPVRHSCKFQICNPEYSTDLTTREKEVISLFVKFSEEEIAERLFISPFTVHNHITKIYSKLGFSGKTAPKMLVDFAHKMNLL